MTPRETDQELSVEDCHRQAREIMDAAETATTHEAKVDFLRLATEWLKLATAIGNRTRDRKN